MLRGVQILHELHASKREDNSMTLGGAASDRMSTGVSNLGMSDAGTKRVVTGLTTAATAVATEIAMECEMTSVVTIAVMEFVAERTLKNAPTTAMAETVVNID